MISTSEEVGTALREGRPVVALESTIIAHGLPFPENLALAKELEADVRAGGATPATLCVIDGQLKGGLSEVELERLADPASEFAKAGGADLAVMMAKGASAATTVSGTSAIAAMLGIRVFATGGIGGVHPGDAMDVSADLLSLSQVPLAVVSAGAKAILDLPKTQEALESLAVLVVGFGCSEMPAFYSRHSGLQLEHQVSDVSELATIMQNRWDVLRQGGILVANPPPESVAIAAMEVQEWAGQAMREARSLGLEGKKLTPFLLSKIKELSEGRSVVCNIALARHNAQLAGVLAHAYAKLSVSA